MKKPELLVLKGLPASGKTTRAKELVSQGWKRVNKDDLRAMIDYSVHSKKNEEYIRKAEADLVKLYLSKGHNVVVDSTNFAYEDYWKEIAGQHFADFRVEFLDTPLLECIERDAKRGDKAVGAKVIQGMYDKYLKPEKISNGALRHNPCYIFDIDGTLAHMENRGPFDYDKVDQDSLDIDVAMMLRFLHMGGHTIFIFSGRDSSCREKTEDWIARMNLPHHGLYMRAEGDTRNDSIIKKELYEQNIKGKFHCLGVFDDRNRVVDMWRSLGLTCFQVGYGYF